MGEPRKRSIGRRLVRAAVMVVLPPLAYLASVATLCMAFTAGVLPPNTPQTFAWRFYMIPLGLYASSDLPGSGLSVDLIEWSATVGKRMHDN
jgi:hypothetical protein